MIGGYFNLRITGPETSPDAKPNSLWAPISIGGSPAELAEAFEQYRRAGLENAICLFESEDLDDYLRQIQVFAEEIVLSLTGASHGMHFLRHHERTQGSIFRLQG